mmetsp:Transcript_1060/g.1499  ORF Transcript_1060/g.1499 Transcript_1060/m.1499 type:complete len:182 (+) Transcript_1060:20-565(+)
MPEAGFLHRPLSIFAFMRMIMWNLIKRKSKYCLLLLIFLFSTSTIKFSADAKAEEILFEEEDHFKDCMIAGPCLDCVFTEKFETYCQKTNKRQELACKVNETQTKPDTDENYPLNHEQQRVTHIVQAFRSCSRTAEDEATFVFRFQFAMLGLGGLAFLGVIHEKNKHQSLYERRLRSQNSL